MKKKLRILIFLFLILMILPTGCGNQGPIAPGSYYYPAQEEKESSGNGKKEDDEQVNAVIGTDMYLIIDNDMTTEHLILEQLASGRQYMYYYSLTTRFLNKYGDHTAVSYFEPGRIVNIGQKDKEGRLKEVRISDDVWEYPDISRYTVDEERGVFEIGDTKYTYKEDMFVVSNGEQIALSSLKDGEKLRAVGMNKEILSVAVTTGYGKVELQNTEIFKGSFIQIGRKIFAEITGDMTVEIPEGTYTLTAANKGYGGSVEITVARDQTTVVDLNEIKGEGPKKGRILFAIDVEGAALHIDGKDFNYDEEITLDYGVHTIAAYAPGYPSYKKKLFVNSQEATIVISLSDEELPEKPSDSSTESETEISTEEIPELPRPDGDSSGGTAGNGILNTESESDTPESDDPQQYDPDSDYLSTLSELLSTIVN